MGAAQQRLLACLVHCLAISALQTQAVLLSRPVFFADIQTAINNVPAGNSALVTVIEIPEGEVVDFGMNSLVINKVGVTLKSAGPGPVTFQSASTLTTTSIPGCADTPSGIPFVQICNGNGPPPAAPITFEGIIFKNTLIWPNNKGNGPNKGIEIFGYSGTPSRPCRVTNCQFINLWGQPPNVAGVGIEFTTVAPLSDNWIISGNTFEGTRQGVYINDGNDGISITGNSFTRFFTCVRVGNNDVSTGIAITGNTMVGGWTPADSTPPAIVQAIALSAAASTPTADRNWLIQNNDISGVNQAIEIRGDTPPYGFVGLNINTNSIVANYGCPLCAAVYNTAPTDPPNLSNNWWGSNPPDASKFVSTSINIPSPSESLSPWIASFDGQSCGAGQPGFCPTDVIDSTVVVPNIIAVTADPNFLSPGQPFGLTVTLAAPGVSFGTLRAVSNPAGTTCQSADLAGAVTEVTLPCTAPPAPSTSAQAAAALQQDQQQPEAAQQAAAMPAAAEAVDASTQNLPLLNPAAATKSYTITAIASADRTDTQATTVTVCQNIPWPFRADVEGCTQCGYNCATGLFSCASCKCHCSKTKHPYHGAERPDADKPYEPESEQYDNPAKRAYEDTPYAEDTHTGYKEEDRPYAAPEHRAYTAPDERRYPAPGNEEDSYGEQPDGGSHYHAQGQRQEARSGDTPYAEDTHTGYKEEDRPYAAPEHRAYTAPDERRYPAPGSEEDSYGEQPDGGSRYHAQGQRQEAWSGDERHERDMGERPSHYSGRDGEEEYPAGRAHEHRAHSEHAHDQEKDAPYAGLALSGEAEAGGEVLRPVKLQDARQAAVLWHPYFSYADEPVEADCSADASRDCVCGPAPLTVTAGCDSVVYDPCSNTLRCSSSGGY